MSHLFLLADAEWVHNLPAVNATLNATAGLLLLAGYWLIKQRRELAHKRAMLSAFVVSILFLGCYLFYHSQVKHENSFVGPPAVRTVYLSLLLSHIVLAALVPFLAVGTIWLGLRDRRAAHRKLARWTFPIWLYVSVTGVIVYVMLYHLYPTPRPTSKIGAPRQAISAKHPGRSAATISRC